jgi:TetR/AcrR family transcriptional regulator, cholesterol catabolism regulator
LRRSQAPARLFRGPNKSHQPCSRGMKTAIEKRQRGRPSMSETTRQRILDIAAELFATRGYEQTSMRDISAEVGMKPGSLYYYFQSKDVMLDAVLRTGVERLHSAVERAVDQLPAGTPVLAQIESAMAAHLAALHGQAAYIRANVILFAHAPASVRKASLIVRRRYGDYWRSLLERAAAENVIRSDLDLSVVRLFVLGALNGSIDWFDPQRRPLKLLASSACRLFLDGLQRRK